MPIGNLSSWGKFLVWFVIHIWFPGCVITQDVTLDSLEIFTKHEWFKSKPTIYFQCKGENKTVLPDVTKTHVLYTFLGEESWQPLTEIHGAKCKRCGFYEKDSFRSEDVFDEWEFCPSDFSASQIYVHFKDKEMNATFLCHGCTQLSSGSNATSSSGSGSASQEEGENEIRLVVVVVASIVVSTVVVVGVVSVCRYSQRKKRQQDQARFMKLFEDGDELEDELGLGTVI